MIRPKSHHLSALLLAVLLAAGPIAAQDTPPFDVRALATASRGSLSLGGSAEAALSVQEPEHWWTLPLRYGDTVFIAVNADVSAELVPRLRLIDPEGKLAAQDDNPGYARNALIRQFTALQEGAYYLGIRDARQSIGAYTVLVGRLPATPEGQLPPTPTMPTTPLAPTITPEPTPKANQRETLHIGQTVEATLSAGERHSYTIEGTGGMPLVVDMIGLEVSPTALDPYLELYGPSGELLFENDDINYGQVDARLVVTLPTTSVYTLVARGFGDRNGGTYRLSLQIGALWQ